MGSSRVLLALAVVSASLTVTPGAAHPGSASAIHSFGPHSFDAAALFTADCTLSGVEMLFDGLVEDGASEIGKFHLRYSGARAWVAEGEYEVVPPLFDGALGGRYLITRSYDAGDTIRMVVASFGGSMQCSFAIDGEPIAGSTPPLNNGAWLTDRGPWTTGGSVAAGTTNAVVSATYERQVDGFLWYFWTNEAGSITVIGPDGIYDRGSGVLFDAWSSGMERTNGTWTFASEAAVGTDLVVVAT